MSIFSQFNRYAIVPILNWIFVERCTARSIGATMPGLPPIQGSTRTWAQSFKVWAVVSPYRQGITKFSNFREKPNFIYSCYFPIISTKHFYWNAGASKPLAIGGRGGNAAAMVLSVNGLRFASELSAVAALRELYKIPSGRSTDCFFKIIALLLLFGNSLHFGGEVFGYLFLLFLLFCFIGFYLLW